MTNTPPALTEATPGNPAATLTRVLWVSVTGAQLEELLYGLFEAMGASSLTWRAGSVTGVTATDGGRDLEAVFDRPSPDGELDRQAWWIESKGRGKTVERAAVQQAVLDASARTDIDVLVVATNSRFSNPTRDWLAERARSHLRPVVKLWDRDHLDRLVRKYPTVAARVLPEALSDEDRLSLLIDRFVELGEEPSLIDLEFFWNRRDWLMNLESELLSRAVAMFLYTEGVPLPRKRPWWQLLQTTDAPDGLITSLITMPLLARSHPRPRPLEIARLLASSGRMLIACLLLLPEQLGLELALRPEQYVTGIQDDERFRMWHEDTLYAVLTFARSELVDACAADCARVTADNPHETNSIGVKEFWGVLANGNSIDSGSYLIIEASHEPCALGLDVSAGCPLVVANTLSNEQVIRGIQAVLRIRRIKPGGISVRKAFSPGHIKFTSLEDHGLSWWTVESNSAAASVDNAPAVEDQVVNILTSDQSVED